MPAQNRRSSSNGKKSGDPPLPPAAEAVSPWKTPTGITAIIGAVTALIIAITNLLPLISKPAAVVTATAAMEPVLVNYCDGFFEGHVIEAQIGIPIAVDTSVEKLITVKLMNNVLLIGSLKFVSAINTIMIADAKCEELLKPTPIKASLDNNFLFGDYSLTYNYDEQAKKLNLSVIKK